MPAEFEAEVRNSMRALQAAVEGLGRAQVKTNAEVARFGTIAQQAFQQAAQKLPPVEEAGKKAAKSWREVGHALGKLGGPLGEIAARFSGGLGMEGGIGKLAIAAAGAGLALKAMNAVVQRGVEDARAAAEAWRKMSDAVQQAREKANAGALGAVGQAPDRRRVRAIGGQEGIDQLDAITAGGVVDEASASAGLSAIYGRFGRTGQATAAIAVARSLAQTGVGFDQAASALAAQGSDVRDPNVGRQVAARIYNQQYGIVTGGTQAFEQALVDTGGDTFLTKSAEAQGVRAQTAGVQREGVIAGKAEVAARAELAAARDPVTAAVLQVYNAHQREIDVLERIASSQNGVAAAIANLGMLLGGEGSERQKASRALVAFAKGTAGMSYGEPPQGGG